jgi:hypothetical protein
MTDRPTTRATDAQVERWAETGTGYSLEEGTTSPDERIVNVINGDATEHYVVTDAQAERLQQAAREHGTNPSPG